MQLKKKIKSDWKALTDRVTCPYKNRHHRNHNQPPSQSLSGKTQEGRINLAICNSGSDASPENGHPGILISKFRLHNCDKTTLTPLPIVLAISQQYSAEVAWADKDVCSVPILLLRKQIIISVLSSKDNPACRLL